MKKNVYLTIVIVATVASMLFGTLYHLRIFRYDHVQAARKSEVVSSAGSTETAAGKAGAQTIPDTANEVTGLDVDMAIGSLTLQPGETWQSVYDGEDRYEPSVEYEEGVLRIYQENKPVGLKGAHKVDLTVTIPEGQVLTFADISLALGEVELSSLTIDDVTIHTSLGDVEMEGCLVGQADIRSNMGDVQVQDTGFTTMTIDQDLGDVEVETAQDMAQAEIDLQTALGDVKVKGRNQGTAFYQEGSGEISLAVHNDMGDIRLDY